MSSKCLQTKKDSQERVRNTLIAIYFFISFFEVYLNGSIGAIVKYFMIVLVFILFFMSKEMEWHGYHLPLFVWIFYKFLSALWTPDYYIFNLHALTHLSMFAILLAITLQKDNDMCYKYARNSLWFGSALSGILSLFFSRPYAGVSNRLVLSLFNVQCDPNNQAAFLLFGIAISMYVLLYEKKHPLLHLAVIGINCYATLMTASRGGLVALFLIVVGYMITLFDKTTFLANYKRIVLFSIIVIAASIVAFRFLPADTFERLFDFDSYEGGSERTIMWTKGINMLTSPIALLFGRGWGAYYAITGYSSMHNTFLSILCDVGLIGLLLFFAPVILALGKLLKNRYILPFAVFIAGMAPSFFIEAINKRFFWNTITFIFIAYNCLNAQNKNVTQTNRDLPRRQ